MEMIDARPLGIIDGEEFIGRVAPVHHTRLNAFAHGHAEAQIAIHG